jgi:hypothetical protein
MFSRVETAITLTVWHYAKTPPEIAKVVFSGAKIDTPATYIKQLAAATRVSRELRNDLDEVLQQLGNGARNKVLHYGASDVAEGNAFVTDALKAKGQPETFPISQVLLDQMTADLTKIIAHLNEAHLQKPSEYSMLGNPRSDAWRYKHPAAPKTPSMTAPAQPRRKRGPKEPRPHESSRG